MVNIHDNGKGLSKEEFNKMIISMSVSKLVKLIKVKDVLKVVNKEDNHRETGRTECIECNKETMLFRKEDFICTNCGYKGNSIELYHKLVHTDVDYLDLVLSLVKNYRIDLDEKYLNSNKGITEINVEDILNVTVKMSRNVKGKFNVLSKKFYRQVDRLVNSEHLSEDIITEVNEVVSKYEQGNVSIEISLNKLNKIVQDINNSKLSKDADLLNKILKLSKNRDRDKIMERLNNYIINKEFDKYRKLRDEIKEHLLEEKRKVEQQYEESKIASYKVLKDNQDKVIEDSVELNKNLQKAKNELKDGNLNNSKGVKNLFHLISEIHEKQEGKIEEPVNNVSPYKNGVILNDCNKCGNLRNVYKFNEDYSTRVMEECECVKLPFKFNTLNTLSKEFKPNMNLIKYHFSDEEYKFIKNTSLDNLIRIYKETLPTHLQTNNEIKQVLDGVVELYKLFQFNNEKGLYIEDNHYLFNLPNSIYLTPVVSKIVLSMLEKNIMVTRYEDMETMGRKNVHFIKEYIQKLSESEYDNEHLIEEVQKNLLSGNTGFNRINDNSDKSNRIYSKIIKDELRFNDVIIVHLSDNLKPSQIKEYRELINYCNKNNKLLITFSSIILSTVFLTTKDIRDYKSGKEVSIKFNSNTRAVLNDYNYKKTLGKYYSSKYYKYGGTMNVVSKLGYLMEYDKKVYDKYKNEDNEYNIRYTQVYTCSRDIMYDYEVIKEVNEQEYGSIFQEEQLRIYLEGINIYNDIKNIDTTMYRLSNDKGKLSDVEKLQAEQEEYYRRKRKLDIQASKEDEVSSLEWEDIFNENTVYGDYYDDDGYYYEEEEEEEEVVYDFDDDFNKFLDEQLQGIDGKEQEKVLDLDEIDELLKLIE